MKKVNLPVAVKAKLLELEKNAGRKLSVLKHYKENYYIYSYANVMDESINKQRSITRYVGIIRPDGTFVPPRRKEAIILSNGENLEKDVKRSIEKLRETYKSITVVPMGNKFYIYNTEFPERPGYLGFIEPNGNFLPYDSPSKVTGLLDDTDSKILRCLSMNARMSMKRIASIAHTNVYTVRNRKIALEKMYGIRYMAEVDWHELDYNEYICFVKFEGVIPSAESLRSALSKEPRVQMAALTKGNYDLMIYFVAKNNDDITTALYLLRQGLLKEYKALWYLTPYNNYYGYIPLRDEFFDLVEEDKVWHREKEEPRKPRNKMTYSEYVTLRELNTNGDSEFTEIAGRFHLKPYNIQYAYRALKDKYKFLSRITLTLHNLPLKYNAVLIMKIKDMAAFQDTRKNLMLNVIEEKIPSNKYITEGDISSPYSVIFIAPIFSDNDLAVLRKSITDEVKGIELEDMIVTEVIVGRLCYRLFDNMYSMQYKPLVEKYKLKTYDHMILYDKETSYITGEPTVE